MDETMDLIRRAHAGDEEAREQLVMGNVGLVWSVARHYSGRGHELEDLFQIGCIGLLKAVDKFDLGFQVRLADPQDIKRLLAVYYQQDVTTDHFDDYDGERWVKDHG